jgi:hypothetical protein
LPSCLDRRQFNKLRGPGRSALRAPQRPSLSVINFGPSSSVSLTPLIIQFKGPVSAYLEVVPAAVCQLLVSQYPRRDGELAVAAKRVEEEGAVAVEGDRGEAHPEDTLLAPLEVEPADVVVPGKGVRHEVAVVDAPGLVPLPGVDDQAVAELVRHVGECILAAALAQIHGDVRDERILGEGEAAVYYYY